MSRRTAVLVGALCAAGAHAFAPAFAPSLRVHRSSLTSFRGMPQVQPLLELRQARLAAPKWRASMDMKGGVEQQTGSSEPQTSLPQTAAISAAVTLWAVVLLQAFSHGAEITADDVKHTISLLPSCFAMIGSSDVMAQLLGGAKFRPGDLFNEKEYFGFGESPSVDFKQSAKVGMIGAAVTGLGTNFWLHGLHHLFPAYTVGVGSPEKLLHLAEKVVFDSAVWGTIVNSLCMVFRMIASGKTNEEAYEMWSAKIFGVMKSEMTFWPLWGAMTFSMLPPTLHVESFALGQVFWQLYLSTICRTTATAPAPAPVVPGVALAAAAFVASDAGPAVASLTENFLA
ncbi:hypothetical protein T484DRAFT_1825164 [Baffinella frigidus]|nr:hypothetical protein T484DRAFT_1825164 [Cryptophyta sp. CCMP2293]